MKIAIIGAGITGMSAAYDLVRAGHAVTILEAESFTGGLASGFKEPHWDWSVERYYHHWFASDHHILRLINELGLSHKVRFPRPYTVLLHNGKWYPFDSILQAILFPGLGWGVDKVRFGLIGLYLRLTKNWQPLERVTTEAWMRKWAGSRVYEKMWKPLLIGKFGPYYKEVPMSWMWARLHARTTQLGTYVGGFQAFADDFAARLQALGVRLRLSTPVTRITQNSTGRLTLETPAGPQQFDQALVTTSPASLAHLAPELPTDYLDRLHSLKSMGAVVLVLALRHQLSEQGHYWHNIPKTAGYPFLILVEHTNFIPPEHFGGDHIVYIGDYLDPSHEYFTLSKEELLERFLPSLPRFNPKFQPNWVKKSWLFRTSYAQPVPELHHSQRLPAIPTPIPGLYFASMSQVYPWDRGTNFAVEIGRRSAGVMME
jgi:protoporphyrinogen oxidase